MPIDSEVLGNKVTRFRDQLQVSIEEVSADTGIAVARLRLIEAGGQEPTGDEVLILADYFQCDYNYFISSEQLTSFERTEKMYRMHGDDFSKADRRSIQEFLFLCQCESYLWSVLEKKPLGGFSFKKRDSLFKTQGKEAAHELRRFLGYDDRAGPPDIYRDMQRIGIHVFRRKLGSSRVSGLCLRHPLVGDCVLVNYSEDVFRQRFSAAHEAAHAILDDESDVIVSYRGDSKLEEIRANNFASGFLLPPAYLRAHLSDVVWTATQVQRWVKKLQVSPEVLAIALKQAGVIDGQEHKSIKEVRIPPEEKADPQIRRDLSPKSVLRVTDMLERGLSPSYVELCFDAFDESKISRGRLAEMLLSTMSELFEIADLHGRRLPSAD